jgi:hypothetical protein
MHDRPMHDAPMHDGHVLRRILTLLGALGVSVVLTAAGCSTSGRDLPAPTTTSPLGAVVRPPATTGGTATGATGAVTTTR